MPVELAEWHGSLSRAAPHPAKLLKATLQQSTNGSSGTFRGRAEDGQIWWVKPVNQLQGGKTIVTEQVIGRVGKAIGAPVCDVTLIEIDDDTAGWEFRSGATTAPGLAHGSADVGDPNEEHRQLLSRDRDDNARRHAGVYALWDWCYGGDDQWLYAGHDDESIFAHDLGHFLPGSNSWTEATLVAQVDQAGPTPWPPDGLDAAELERLADAIESLPRSALVSILNGIPAAWPVTTQELETLGWFLERRQGPCADRLRELARKLSTPAA